MAEQKLLTGDKLCNALLKEGRESIAACSKKMLSVPGRYDFRTNSKFDYIQAFISNSNSIIWSLGNGKNVDAATLDRARSTLFAEVIEFAYGVSIGKQATGIFNAFSPLGESISKDMCSDSIFRHGR